MRKKLTCACDPTVLFGEEREAASRRLMTEGGVGGRRGGRGKTGSSSPPQIKGADLDVHQRTQTGGIDAQMNRML